MQDRVVISGSVSAGIGCAGFALMAVGIGLPNDYTLTKPLLVYSGIGIVLMGSCVATTELGQQPLGEVCRDMFNYIFDRQNLGNNHGNAR